jgi:uncharacterized alpha-E superfamily protein
MLSRIAESLFWIGRYAERADDTARIVDVHLQVLLEDRSIDEDLSFRSLLSVMGLTPPAQAVGRRRVLDQLVYDRKNQSSIVGSLQAARENARGAREVVSSEMWEALNATWNAWPAARRRSLSPHEFLAWVRERAAVVAGVADASMSRDEGWQFLVLGRSLERADMTARLVATRASPAGPSWTHLMRSCSAYQAFLRTYRGAIGDEHSAEFLILDRLFPRSIFSALSRAEHCLEQLDPAAGRVGVLDEARRTLGRVRTGLEFRGASELLVDLTAEMERIQGACSLASDAVSRRYFPRRIATKWVGEVVS